MRSFAGLRENLCVRAALVALGVVLAPVAAGAYQKEVKTLAGELGKTVQAAGKTTIAVVDFTDLEGNVTALGRFLAEELSVSLAESASEAPGGFDVIDRNHLASLLREHKLTASGLLNRITARKLGQISGVEALVTGSLTDFGGDEVRISVKVLDMSTAKVIGAKQANIAQSSTIRGLLAQGITANEVTEAAESSERASSPGSTVPATTTTTARQTANPPSVQEGPQLAESNGFVFELQGCQRSGQTVECHLRIANRGSDRPLHLFQDSRIFDERGNQYGPFHAEIANATGRLPYSNSWLRQTLIHNVPVHASLSFAGFSPEASRVTSFYLVGEDGEDNRFRVDFRNVPITAKPIASLGGGVGGQGSPGGAGAGGVKQVIQDEAIDAARKSIKKWKDKLLGSDEPADGGGGQTP
jgi:TolB-like protein